MDRRLPLVVAFAVVALLVGATVDARAETGTEAPDSTATIAPEAAPLATQAPGNAEPPLQDATPTSVPDVAAPAPVPIDPPTPPVTSQTPPAPTPPAMAAPPSPPSPPTVTPLPHPPPAENPSPAPPASQTVASSSVPPAPARVAPAATARPPEPSLERMLPAAERSLRKVQADVEAIRRQVDSGAVPPASRLNRLRSRLEQLAPVLRALDARVDAVGGPSQATQVLLHRVRVRLAATQVSTAGLITALRHSGLHPPELRGLVRELESFVALGSALDLSPEIAHLPLPYVPTSTPLDPQHPVAGAAPTARPAGDSSSRPLAALSRAEDRPEPVAHKAPAPWSPGSGSANASPGGAAAVAGLASLAALLIGLALSRLLTRLELAPRRGYAVASLLALERPD